MAFEHEQMDVYQAAIAYVGWAYRISAAIKGHRSAREQLQRASQSVPRHIAKGGCKSGKERDRHFAAAREALLECTAVQDILVVCGALSNTENAEARTLLNRVDYLLTARQQSADGACKASQRTDTPETDSDSGDDVGPALEPGLEPVLKSDPASGHYISDPEISEIPPSDTRRQSQSGPAEIGIACQSLSRKKTVSIPCSGCVFGATFFESEEEYFEAPSLKILEAEVGSRLSDYGWIKTFDTRFTHSPDIPAYLCPDCQKKYF